MKSIEKRWVGCDCVSLNNCGCEINAMSGLLWPDGSDGGKGDNGCCCC